MSRNHAKPDMFVDAYGSAIQVGALGVESIDLFAAVVYNTGR